MVDLFYGGYKAGRERIDPWHYCWVPVEWGEVFAEEANKLSA